MTRRLIHYSDQPLVKIRGAVQTEFDPARGSRFEKPKGLWVSAEGDDDWATWCASESFRNTDAQYATQVHLAPGAEILRMAAAEELIAFTREHGRPEDVWMPGRGILAINWESVAHRYAWIIISPYVWECRMPSETRWYYGWDCASGCIWDPAAIEGLEQIHAPKTKAVAE